MEGLVSPSSPASELGPVVTVEEALELIWNRREVLRILRQTIVFIPHRMSSSLSLRKLSVFWKAKSTQMT